MSKRSYYITINGCFRKINILCLYTTVVSWVLLKIMYEENSRALEKLVNSNSRVLEKFSSYFPLLHSIAILVISK